MIMVDVEAKAAIEVEAEVRLCKNCGSKQLVLVKMDFDWGDGGDVVYLNSQDSYPEEKWNKGRYELGIDMLIQHCLACGAQE